jgi:hypothetical protein
MLRELCVHEGPAIVSLSGSKDGSKIVNRSIDYPVWHILKDIFFILDRKDAISSSSFNNRTMEK